MQGERWLKKAVTNGLKVHSKHDVSFATNAKNDDDEENDADDTTGGTFGRLNRRLSNFFAKL